MPHMTLDRFTLCAAIAEACERTNPGAMLRIVRDGMTNRAQYGASTLDGQIFAAMARLMTRAALTVDAMETITADEFTGDASGYALALAKRIDAIGIKV